MATENHEPFEKLKQEVQHHAAEKLGIHKALTDWSLQDIRDFQADLEVTCKSSVSEKWVYTHFKNESKKLPRIDVLNLLSQWIGYKNWDEFLRKHPKNPVKEKKNTKAWLLTLPIVFFLFWMMYQQKAEVVLVFKDAYTHASIAQTELTVSIKNQTVANGYVSKKMAGDTLIVDGPYYKRKSVYLPPSTGDTFVVEMLPDDYALMLNFFSRSTADDLDKRRNQLMDAIHAEAKIFQSHPQYEGIEMLNREEFIDRLILPLNSLKNLEIQHIIYKDEKIYRLQFLQKTNEDENI